MGQPPELTTLQGRTTLACIGEDVFMRKMLGILIMFVASNIVAQTQGTRQIESAKQKAAQMPEETLAIGSVALHLGTTQDVVLGQLTRAGYRLTKNSEAGWSVMQPNGNGADDLGYVSFKKNLLTFINRRWTQSGLSAAEVAEGLYGVLASLYEQGRRTCFLQTGDKQNPTSEVKNIYLTCVPGHSHVSVTIARLQDGNELVSVEEILNDDGQL